MKFINKSSEPKKIRLGEPLKYRWVTVRQGEQIEAPEKVGINKGLTKMDEEEKEESVKTTVNGKKAETKILKKKEAKKKPVKNNFIKELKKIKGIGKKTAQDILKLFPTKEKMINSIELNKPIPIRDDLEKKLIKKYGKK